MRISNQTATVLKSEKPVGKVWRGLVSAVVLLTFLLSSTVVPIKPVASSSPDHTSSSQLQAEVDVCLSPTISTDTTWSAGNVYKADCVVTVNAGVTLTVEGGAVVQFGGSTRGLRVLGTLNVTGSAGNPAVFTSLNDDPANTWYGIVLHEGSSAVMNYASIRYGGAYVCVGDFADSVYNSCYSRTQLDVRKASLTMNFSEVVGGQGAGIVLDGEGLTPSIQNTLISDNNSLEPANRAAEAIYQTTINMQPTYANLTFSGNDRDLAVMPVGTLKQDVNFGGAPIGFTCGSNYCPITVASPHTLTIQPGAQLDMTLGYPIFYVVQAGGTLNAIGTESQPITMVMGRIDFEYGSHGTISHCDISGNPGSVMPGLNISADGIHVSDTVIHDHTAQGVSVFAGLSNSIGVTFTNVDVINNAYEGIYLNTTIGGVVNFSMDGGTVSGNGRSGIKVSTTNGVIFPTLKNLLIDANGIGATYDSDKRGLQIDTINASPILENLTITNHPGMAIYWRCDGSISAKNITASGNAAGNELQMPGCAVTSGRQWDLADAGIPVHVTNYITVESGGVLSINPGVMLGFDANQQFYVKPGGSLYALGTADEPIILTRYSDSQTPWKGVQNSRGTMILRHCEISFAEKGLTVGASSIDPATNSIVQNCKIHDNAVGIWAYAPTYATTNIVYNEIFNNPTFGVDWGGFSADPVNAYYNYWGDPSGPYHATLNPDGLGNPVDDNINFDPFLTTPPEDQALVGDMWVSTAGPATISPGEVNDYAIQYLNLQADPVLGAVAVIQLPLAGKYLSSTAGGTYWPARHQVFWLLGDLNPGASGMLSARVRFDWGLAPSYTDGSYTILAGTNYQPEVITISDYLDFQKDEIDDITSVAVSIIPYNPNFQTLYDQAIADGYEYREAYETTFEGGGTAYIVMMRTPDKKYARTINLDNGHATATTTDGSTFYRIEDLEGGMSTNLLTLETTLWGAWEIADSAATVQVECNYERCMRNCSMKKISIEMMKDAAKGAAVWLFGIPAFGGIAVTAWAVYEAADLAHEIYLCYDGCKTNPLTGCCNPGDVLWSPSTLMGNSHCSKYICSSSSLSYPPTPNDSQPCGYGARCVAGYNNQGGCRPCVETYAFMLGPEMEAASVCSGSSIDAATTKCSDLTIRVAKDPNAIYGPVGDVLPTEVMDYRITCENEGAGDAYGVYIVNDLPEELDETTLAINDGGIYLAAERQIVWYIGELGPKGDPTSEAEVTYSADLKPGLAAGTAVVNQATVYFPSVPEETPTNTWTNLVYPLVATPQALSTNYMTPLAVALAGRPAGGLTFTLESLPLGGTLSGTLPNLTYTPIENFAGVDFFTFTVTKGVETSQPAQITINVSTAGDTSKPGVLWVQPEMDQTEVPASSAPVYTLEEGGVYAPVIAARLSEKVQENSITAASVVVKGPGGEVIPSKATFDPATNQLTIQLLAPLGSEKTYTVTFSTAIKDLAGNAMAAYTWQFTTAEVASSGAQIFLPMIIK